MGVVTISCDLQEPEEGTEMEEWSSCASPVSILM